MKTFASSREDRKLVEKALEQVYLKINLHFIFTYYYQCWGAGTFFSLASGFQLRLTQKNIWLPAPLSHFYKCLLPALASNWSKKARLLMAPALPKKSRLRLPNTDYYIAYLFAIVTNLTYKYDTQGPILERR